eukprot:GDKI01019158.1.p1 GENE.GDKI01019158.1~~GDKI01019158.1.p1  ORF type:complete len:336 (-),score=95.27 GDKI01019158.1:630-1637(-)
MVVPQKQGSPFEDFYWVNAPEPHAVRRRQILEKHPEIKQLYGPDIKQAYFCLATVAVQLAMIALIYRYDFSWPVVCVMTYVISGTANHSLQLAMHELSHGLFFKTRWLNDWFAIFVANVPTGFPSACTFKRYHLEHHTYQGVDDMDMDIPTRAEGFFFQNPLTKLLFVMLQPAFYALRPGIVKPKQMTPMEALNWVVQLCFDFAVWHLLGNKAIFYVIFGSLWGLGLHPTAGHFIAEHYVFTKGHETYSYYGPLNWLVYNVGYHNEHHDFPAVPGSRLPEVKRMAPEFYDTLPSYTSWVWVIWHFVTASDVTCFSRIKRKTIDGDTEKNNRTKAE